MSQNSLLFSDPRVLQARRLIREAVCDLQAPIQTIKPADPDRAAVTAAVISQFESDRGGSLVYPYLSSGLGNGPFIELLDGSVKLDLINGIGAHFGHSLPDLIDATFPGFLSDTVMQGNLQQSEPSVHFTRLLIDASGLDHCFLSTSGAMAAENALKMAFQARSPRRRILAFEGCFMGRTIALASITDKAAYRDGLPIGVSVDYVPFYSESDHDGSIKRAVAALKSHLHRYPNDHAAMTFELVQGEGGYYTAPREFFVALMTELRAADIAIIVDEIQTFGRLSRLFAFQHYGLDDFVDIVTVGKITQCCATLFRRAFVPRPGLVSQTFTGASTAILAGIHVVNTLLNGPNFGERGLNMTLGHYFSQRMSDLETLFPDDVSGPFGIGMMMAFTPYKGVATDVKTFSLDLFQDGVIGFTAGSAPMRMRFLPPLGASSSDLIDLAVNAITRVLSKKGGNHA